MKGSQITTLPSNAEANPVATAGEQELTNYLYILLAIGYVRSVCLAPAETLVLDPWGC